MFGLVFSGVLSAHKKSSPCTVPPQSDLYQSMRDEHGDMEDGVRGNEWILNVCGPAFLLRSVTSDEGVIPTALVFLSQDFRSSNSANAVVKLTRQLGGESRAQPTRQHFVGRCNLLGGGCATERLKSASASLAASSASPPIAGRVVSIAGAVNTAGVRFRLLLDRLGISAKSFFRGAQRLVTGCPPRQLPELSSSLGQRSPSRAADAASAFRRPADHHFSRPPDRHHRCLSERGRWRRRQC